MRGENPPHEDLIARERKREEDVRTCLGFDKGMVCLPVILLQPLFEKKVFEETEDLILFQDRIRGDKEMNKKVASRPQYLHGRPRTERALRLLRRD